MAGGAVKYGLVPWPHGHGQAVQEPRRGPYHGTDFKSERPRFWNTSVGYLHRTGWVETAPHRMQSRGGKLLYYKNAGKSRSGLSQIQERGKLGGEYTQRHLDLQVANMPRSRKSSYGYHHGGHVHRHGVSDHHDHEGRALEWYAEQKSNCFLHGDRAG